LEPSAKNSWKNKGKKPEGKKGNLAGLKKKETIGGERGGERGNAREKAQPFSLKARMRAKGEQKKQ